jgi:hypothetical protein
VSTSTLSTYSADDFNDRELLALRLAAKFAATDDIEIIPAVFYQRSDKANPDSYFTNLPDFTTSSRGLPAFSRPLYLWQGCG